MTVVGYPPNASGFGHAVVMTELKIEKNEITFTLKNSLEGEHLLGTHKIGQNLIKLTNKGVNNSGTTWTTDINWPIYYVKFE